MTTHHRVVFFYFVVSLVERRKKDGKFPKSEPALFEGVLPLSPKP